jgi:2-dehydropantoate 2-reductase
MPRRLERIAVCGAGAVGSAYLARLQAVPGTAVAVVAGGARRERLEREGLLVNGQPVAVTCRAPGEEGPAADLLLVAVKQHHLDQAIADARGVVGPETIVVSALNGIASEGALARAFGAEKVLHAFVVGNDLVREGSRTRYTQLGRMVLGAASNDPADPRVLAVKDLLDRAGIAAVVPPDIHREQWWKFMLNVGVNQVSAVLRAPYAAFALPEVQALTRAAAREVLALAGPEGIALGPEDVERIFPTVGALGPTGKTSMLQDVEAGRKTEVEIFAGTVVELGEKHGIATPVNRMLGELIRAMERIAGAR